MKNNFKNNQSGIAHLGLLLFVVVVFAAIGFVGYRVMNKDAVATSVKNPVSTSSDVKDATVSASVLDQANGTEDQ